MYSRTIGRAQGLVVYAAGGDLIVVGLELRAGDKAMGIAPRALTTAKKPSPFLVDSWRVTAPANKPPTTTRSSTAAIARKPAADQRRGTGSPAGESHHETIRRHVR